MVQQVAESANHLVGGWAIVVAGEHLIETGIRGEASQHPIESIGMELLVGIHEKKDMSLGPRGFLCSAHLHPH